MIRLKLLVMAVVLGFVPELPLVGGEGDKREEGKEDALIAAMKFVKVPKGTFWMGWESVGKKSKQVTIAADFELAAYTVTQEQWEAVMGKNPCSFSRQGPLNVRVKDLPDGDLKRFPVERVSWDDVQTYLKKVNDRVKDRGWLYRLPTSAEWEYACRGGASTKEECSFDFYLGKPTNDLSSTQANFNGEKPAGKGAKGPFLNRPTKVGSYAPNKLGLYDMHGNVGQWCDDKFDIIDPKALLHVVRSGGWDGPGSFCNAASSSGAEGWNYAVGFRLARVPSAKK